MCVVTVLAAEILLRLHVAQKWDAAVVGTIAPFWYLAGVFRARLALASFWISFAISFLLHILFIWFVFAVILRNVEIVGILVWIPVTMLEGIPLYYLMGGMERAIAAIIEA
jgi:hypothetical protein